MEGNQSSGVAVETGGETRAVAAREAVPAEPGPGRGGTEPVSPAGAPEGSCCHPFGMFPKGAGSPAAAAVGAGTAGLGCLGLFWDFFGEFWRCPPPHLCYAPCPSHVWGAQESPFIKSWNSRMVWVG